MAKTKQYKKSLVNSYTNKYGQKVKVYEQNGVFTTEIDGKPVKKTTNQTQKSTSSKLNYKNTFEPYAEKPRYNTISDIVNYFKPNKSTNQLSTTGIPLSVQKQQGIDASGRKNTNNKTSSQSSGNQPPEFVKQQQGINDSGIRTTYSNTSSSSAVSGNLKSTPTKVNTNSTAKPKPKATTAKVTITLPDGVKTTGYINPKDNRTYYDKDFTKPLKTQGAKVTKIKGSRRDDFTRYKKFEELTNS